MAWLETLKSSQKTCLVQDGRRKIHFSLAGGNELCEEYDVRTGELVVRKWRKKGSLGNTGKWEFEVGEAPFAQNVDSEGMVESSSNPISVRKDTKKCFQWRIRNLPYPVETYDLSVDGDARTIIVKTTNKKYYKKIAIPDMDRAQLPLQKSALTFAHANNTLIITYEKPPEILQQEKLLQEEFKKLKSSKDGEVDCNPS